MQAQQFVTQLASSQWLEVHGKEEEQEACFGGF
jgi:hypothetical protein